MNTYPNAPAPHSALFDNVSTVLPPPTELCPDYTDGVVAVWRNGRTQRGRCRSDRVMTVHEARTALAHGMACVFVLAGDVEAVRGNGKAE